MLRGTRLIVAGSFFIGIRAALFQSDHHIQLACEIPSYNVELPVFLLNPPTQFPSDIHDSILKSATLNISLTAQATVDGTYHYDGNRLVSYFDGATGETAVFPTFGSLQPLVDENINDVSEFLQNPDIFPKDDTKVSVITGSRLRGSTRIKGQDASPPATLLIESIIERNVPYQGHLYPIYGPGSKASFRFGADGTVKAFSHLWRAAYRSNQTVTSRSPDIIWQNIVAQVISVSTVATINSVDLCFYDSGNDFIQPAFRYNASLPGRYIVGHVSAGDDEKESLPSLAQRENDAVLHPRRSPKTPKRQTGSATVGFFIGQNFPDTHQMSLDIWGFYNDAYDKSSGQIWLNYEQIRYADPSFYNTNAYAHMDGVAVACSWGLGSPHNFTTDGSLPNLGSVNISSDVRSTGFGPGVSGMTGYWIIKATGTVQTPDLDPSVHERWYSVFSGMHAVLGYYGPASFSTSGDTGKALGLGQSVVGAWTTNNPGSSVIIVCGHDNDTVFDLDDAGFASCLSVYWGV